MIGWWIGIAEQTPQDRDDSADNKAAIIASWEAGSGGLDWLEKLVQEGKATKLLHNGYPSRYIALARDVLPLIENGPPTHSGPTIIGDNYVTPGAGLTASNSNPKKSRLVQPTRFSQLMHGTWTE